jgi:hypothetical protein
MRKLIVSAFVTVDGIMQAPGGPEEDPQGGFEHGGWAFGYWDDVVDQTMHASMAGGLEVVDSKVSPSGVIMTRYRAGAEIKGGSFA